MTTQRRLLQEKDRGVYLHWVLPSGLRHAYTPGLLDFPALPDHWLIVRFTRQRLNSQNKCVVYRRRSVGDRRWPSKSAFPGR